MEEDSLRGNPLTKFCQFEYQKEKKGYGQLKCINMQKAELIMIAQMKKLVNCTKEVEHN